MSGDATPPPAAVRTLFLGSGSFAVPIVEALVRAPGIDLVGVVSAPVAGSGACPTWIARVSNSTSGCY